MFEDEVTRVGDTLAALTAALNPGTLPGDTATAVYTGLDRIERLAWAGKTLLAATVATGHAGPAGGGRTGTDALARHTGTGSGAARDQLTTSHALDHLPALAAGLRGGQLSATQATLIAAAATADPTAEHRLLALAPQVSIAELRAECARVRAAADPDPETTYRRLRAARRLRRYTDGEGGWDLTARGTPGDGAAFNAVLDPLIDAVFRAARATGEHAPFEAHAFDALMALAELAADHPGDPGTPDNPGDPGDRRGPGGPDGTHDDTDATGVPRDSDIPNDPGRPGGADGHRGPDHATHPDPADGDPVDRDPVDRDPGDGHAGSDPAGDPPVQDTTSAPGDARSDPAADPPAPRRDPTDTDTADDHGRAPAGDRPDPPPRKRRRSDPRYLALLRVDLTALHRGRVTGDELCEIAGIGPVPVTVARDLLGDAVLKLVITRGVDVAHVTHLGRGPTAAQRIALTWTSPQCGVLGCPRTHVQIDHRIDWARTRHTRLDELDPLCPYHHDLKTRHRLGPGPRHRTTRLRPTPGPPATPATTPTRQRASPSRPGRPETAPGPALDSRPDEPAHANRPDPGPTSAHRPDLGPIHARRQDAGSTPTTPCPATTPTKAHPPLIEEPDS